MSALNPSRLNRQKGRAAMSSEFVLRQGAGQKLEFAVSRNGGGAAEIEWLSTGENFKTVILLARGEAELAMKCKPTPEPEPPLDTIIRVDRSILPVYPDWVKKVMHRNMEKSGPAEYDLVKHLELWLHECQKNGGYGKGHTIYKSLKTSGQLALCLSLRDGEEIKKKGIAVFRKLFGGKAIFLWKSVVQYQGGYLFVPYLVEGGDEVVVRWDYLDVDWRGHNPAARFAQ